MSTTHFRIAAEEIVAAYENPDNGSGPIKQIDGELKSDVNFLNLSEVTVGNL